MLYPERPMKKTPTVMWMLRTYLITTGKWNMRLKTDKCIYVTSRVIGTMPLPWKGGGIILLKWKNINENKIKFLYKEHNIYDIPLFFVSTLNMNSCSYH